jgi:hypothetical protein
LHDDRSPLRRATRKSATDAVTARAGQPQAGKTDLCSFGGVLLTVIDRRELRSRADR